MHNPKHLFVLFITHCDACSRWHWGEKNLLRCCVSCSTRMEMMFQHLNKSEARTMKGKLRFSCGKWKRNLFLQNSLVPRLHVTCTDKRKLRAQLQQAPLNVMKGSSHPDLGITDCIMRIRCKQQLTFSPFLRLKAENSDDASNHKSIPS